MNQTRFYQLNGYTQMKVNRWNSHESNSSEMNFITEILQLNLSSDVMNFVYWLDQILLQRKMTFE